MTDLKSAIHPEALDLMFSSATNAGQKGQAQYSTPPEIAAKLAGQLPAFRGAIVDLTCGNGSLLRASANKTTGFKLGMDIDPSRPQMGDGGRFIHADLTAMYESMRQIDFRADCFVLNPPFGLNWHCARLEGLAASAVPAVARSFKAIFAASNTIDSTLATLMIALDRLTENGEGFLIGLGSTLERLLFVPDAPGAPLVRHILRFIPIETDAKYFNQCMVVYFSRAHDRGPAKEHPPFLRRVSPMNFCPTTVELWKALEERAREMAEANPRPQYHLSMVNGSIHVRLGLFDTALMKVNGDLAETAERLYDLNGRNPMQVVMQRDERNFILGLFRPGAEWTVAPDLRDAVQLAVHQYNSRRAPLVPLPKIQRLGYLDESDDILCTRDLFLPRPAPKGKGRGEGDGLSIPVFQSGKRYMLATRSVRFTRTQWKPNLHGEEEELELSGQELAVLISAPRRCPSASDSSEQFCFMDASLRAENVEVDDGKFPIHFTTQDLVDHFEIPEVPHIATTDPDRYQGYVAQLRKLEEITA